MADRLPHGSSGQSQHTTGSGSYNTMYPGPYVADRQMQIRPQMQWPMTTYMMPHGHMQMAPEGMYRAVPPNVNIYMTSVAPGPQQIRQPTEEQQKKWYEEQQRLRGKHEKERIYQLQRQRLSHFQSPIPATITSAGQQPASTYNVDRLIQNIIGQTDKKPVANRSASTQQQQQQQQRNNAGVQAPFVQKPRDWSELGDLRDVFETSYSGFPAWCQEGALVPPLYTQVQQYVTQNGFVDTSLLYPVLLSSGLSRETLGRIWSLANQHTLGQLSKSELYAILAMVALAQNSCQITSLGILHSLQQAPVPLLNQTGGVAGGLTTDSKMPSPVPVTITPVINNQNHLGDDDFDDFQSADSQFATHSTAPAGNAIAQMNVGPRLADQNETHYPSASSCDMKTDDSFGDFSDFQQATAAAIQDTSLCSREEIAAPPTSISCIPIPPSVAVASTNSQSMWSTMSGSLSSNQQVKSGGEDKYSAFRVLEQTVEDVCDNIIIAEDNEFGDFLSGAVAADSGHPQNKECTDDDDDFGFMGYVSRKRSECLVNPNLDAEQEAAQPANLNPDVNSADNDDFGDFVGSCDHQPHNDCSALDNLNFNFLRIIDPGTVSVESQSVSSLDLGINLSRCGSIPSLDLKISSDDDRSESRDSTPSAGIHVGLTEGGGRGSFSSMIAVDRYSIIRSEVLLDESDAIVAAAAKCEWQLCLDACQELLENAVNILREVQEDSAICHEVVESEDGEKYLKNIIEVYRICRRIANSIGGLTPSKVSGILQVIEADWKKLSSFTFLSEVLPTIDSPVFDFSSAVLEADDQNLSRACGVCLLDVEHQRSCNYRLTYSGRQYHASCANFWVNCVDSLLPALTFSHLKQITFQ